jgi:hypothetical protein
MFEETARHKERSMSEENEVRKMTTPRKRSKGCHCEKSHCLKKYCDCFKLGEICG